MYYSVHILFPLTFNIKVLEADDRCEVGGLSDQDPRRPNHRGLLGRL